MANRPVVMGGSTGIVAVSAAVAAPLTGGVLVAGCCAARVVAAMQATAAAVVSFNDVFIIWLQIAAGGLGDSLTG